VTALIVKLGFQNNDADDTSPDCGGGGEMLNPLWDFFI